MKQRVINWLLSKLLNIKSVEKAIEIKNNEIYLDGELIQYNELSNMKKEVELIRQIEAWKQAQKYLIKYSQDQIFHKSQDFATIVNGKMILWTIEQINAFFDSIITKEKISRELKAKQEQLLVNAKKEYKKR
jgi:hypothetical protein